MVVQWGLQVCIYALKEESRDWTEERRESGSSVGFVIVRKAIGSMPEYVVKVKVLVVSVVVMVVVLVRGHCRSSWTWTAAEGVMSALQTLQYK